MLSVPSSTEVEPLKIALRTAANAGNEEMLCLNNSMNFLEGFLNRTTFPDDRKAAKLKQKIASAGCRHDQTKISRLRAEYVGTTRGNLEWRLSQIKLAINNLVNQARTDR